MAPKSSWLRCTLLWSAQVSPGLSRALASRAIGVGTSANVWERFRQPFSCHLFLAILIRVTDCSEIGSHSGAMAKVL